LPLSLNGATEINHAPFVYVSKLRHRNQLRAVRSGAPKIIACIRTMHETLVTLAVTENAYDGAMAVIDEF